MLPRLVLGLLLSVLPRVALAGEGAKVIQFGWGMPDAAFVRTNVREMEKIPFDGVVLNPRFVVDEHQLNLRTAVFDRQPLPVSILEPSAIDLKATAFRSFTDNFIVVAMVPGNVDWFDDWSSILHNTRLAAGLVREAALRGIFLDPEQYREPLFTYSLRPQRARRSFEEYAAQARRRGREWISAVNAAVPRTTILLAFGHVAAELTRGTSPNYALLPAFLDGIIEAASPETVIVDGYEYAYSYRQRQQFAEAASRVRAAGRRLSAVPALHATRVQIGFGLWLDYRSHTVGWFPDAPVRNYFTPAAFREALRAARRVADAYVWVYSERLNWWTGEGVSPAYVEALRP